MSENVAATSEADSSRGVPQKTLLWLIGQAICRLVAILCWDLKVYNKQWMPKTGGVLLASNHQSYLDPVLVAVQLRRPVSYFARATLFEKPFFGKLIRNLHAFPVKRGEGDIGAMKEAIKRLKEGYILNIFPEGTRTLDGNLKSIEPGIALMVRRAQVPVWPAIILGAFEAWPKGRKLPKWKAKIRVIYGQPMILHDLKGDQIVKTIESTFRQLEAELREKIARE